MPKKDDFERRYLTTELRAETDDGKPVIRGYAAVYEQRSDKIWDFYEKIALGAFRKVLAENPDVVCLFNHEPNELLGRTRAGTLNLSENEKGLFYENFINEDDPQAMSTYAKVKRGDVDGSSFAFRVAKDVWENFEDSPPVRTIIEFSELHDVSPVTYPAYPQTSADVRSAAQENQPPDSSAGQEAAEKRDAEAERQASFEYKHRMLDLFENEI
jgi:uncharacterized protein